MAQRKIHLRGNARTEEIAKSICSLRSIGNGKVRSNGRDKYQFMASEIVGFLSFREVPHTNRCAHCCDMGLIKRNSQRKAKGWKQVDRIDDAFIEKE
jgi:hypothetical protein